MDKKSMIIGAGVTFFVMIFLIVILAESGSNVSEASVSTATTSGYDDVGWLQYHDKYSGIIGPDFTNSANATSYLDWSSMAYWGQKIVIDTQEAIDENKNFKTSSKYHLAQEEWGFALADANSAGSYIVKNVNNRESNPSDRQTEVDLCKSAADHFGKCNLYIINAQTDNNSAAQVSTVSSVPDINETSPYTGVLQYCTGSFQVTDPSKGSNVVVISININNTGDKMYSDGVTDWIIEVNNKTYEPYTSGDWENSDKNHLLYISPGNQGFVTYAYLVDDSLVVGSPFKLIYKGLNKTSDDVGLYTIQGFVDQSTMIHKIFSTGLQVTPVTEPEQVETHVKTLADKDQEPEGIHVSEDSADSSTHNISDYCTWQAETTKKIGEYNEAPENKSYVVVTIIINNTGDQTYTTNPYSWHLKIGDMYYQHDSATFDSSLNHMTTDVGPGGKITTKIAYLVDGEPSISDLDLYYDGPGSDGTIHS